jgi:predicted amidohydrolase YtcJ
MISALGPGLRAPSGAVIVTGRGGALLPGLTDHHIHLRAAAAARRSVDLHGGTDLSPLAVLDGIGWVRVVGAGKLLSRTDIDRACSARPVRVQHRSGAVWTLNSRSARYRETASSTRPCATTRPRIASPGTDS